MHSFPKRIRHLVIALFIMLSGGLALVPAISSAADFKSDACAGVNALDNVNSGTCSASSGSTVSRIIKLVINVFSFVVGFTAVIMILIGGFKYITANGDSSNLSSARNTILYAIIGLVIVALAQVLVHFVIANSNAAVNNCKDVTCKVKNG